MCDLTVRRNFAFANAGISFVGLGVDEVFHSIPLGIALGLFFGKQLGILSLCWIAIKLKFTSFPKGMSWGSLYGAAALCGVRFMMSLFIGYWHLKKQESICYLMRDWV
jgi:NhaA family Na+:H+ antiporter